jgi:hypothetical protein
MSTCKRNGNRWTISEIIRLQREYELLDLTVQQIAQKHQRSTRAILCKLEAEGFISSWNDVRGFNVKEYEDICSGAIDEETGDEFDTADSDYVDYDDEQDDDITVDDEESEVDKLTERVWNLETSVKDISSMITKMFDNWVSKKSSKRAPLRKY